MNNAKKKVSNSSSKYLYQMLKLMWDRHPWLTVGTAISGTFGGFAGIAMVDTINSAVYNVDNRPHLLLVFLALAFAILILRSAAFLLPARTMQQITSSLQTALCKKILATPLEEIERRGVPNILAILNNDVPHLMSTLLLLPVILVESSNLLFGLVYLTYLSSALMLMTLVVVPMGFFVIHSFVKRAMLLMRKQRDESVTFNEYTLGLLLGIKELQLNSDRRRWFKRAGFEFSSKRIAKYQFLEKVCYAGVGSVDDIVYFVIVGMFIFGISPFFALSPVILTGAVLALIYVIGPVRSLVAMAPDLGQGVVACERLAEFGFSIADKEAMLLLNKQSELRHASVKHWKTIELQEVCVVYAKTNDTQHSLEEIKGHDESEKLQRQHRFQLGPISMRIQPGELVFIVGSNGSGKSTLSKVLTSLYSPAEGSIFLDGKPVDESSKETYRSLFAAVFSDFHLFDRIIGSDKEMNISTAAKKYLVQLGLDDKIRIDHNKFSTTTALSNGQRSRLALLCAYLEDRPICVLDEWASDQDPPFKKFFYEVLLPDLKRQEKCVIVVTHDDQYFEAADRVIRLKDGQIVSNVDLQRQ